MKEKKIKNKNDKIYNDYILNKIALTTQFVLVILILVFGIVSFFNSTFKSICTLITGLALLVMGYNNHRVYKRKSFTLLYIVIGVLILVFGLVDLLK